MTWVWHQMFSFYPWDRSMGAGQTILTTTGTMVLLINTEGRVWEISMSVLKSVWAQNLKSMCCQSKRLKQGKFQEFKVTFNRYSSALHIKFLEILALFFFCNLLWFHIGMNTEQNIWSVLWWALSSRTLKFPLKEPSLSLNWQPSSQPGWLLIPHRYLCEVSKIKWLKNSRVVFNTSVSIPFYFKLSTYFNYVSLKWVKTHNASPKFC